MQIPLIFSSLINFDNVKTNNFENSIYNKNKKDIENNESTQHKININNLQTYKNLKKISQKVLCSRFFRNFSWIYNLFKKN